MATIKSALREMLEKYSKGIVFRRKLDVDPFHTQMYVSSEGGLKYLVRPLIKIDNMLAAFVNEYVSPGDDVWDIGANLGLFSFMASSKAGSKGSVLAVEADTYLVSLLRRSAKIQGEANAPVKVLPAAIASEFAIREFWIAKRLRATNHLAGSEFGSSQTGGVREKELVVSVTLDWITTYYPPPKVLKIDIEGAEIEALTGATNLLEKHRPVILCEVAGTNRERFRNIMTAAGYRMYDAAAPASARKPLDEPAPNTVAIPNG